MKQRGRQLAVLKWSKSKYHSPCRCLLSSSRRRQGFPLVTGALLACSLAFCSANEAILRRNVFIALIHLSDCYLSSSRVRLLSLIPYWSLWMLVAFLGVVQSHTRCHLSLPRYAHHVYQMTNFN